MCCWCCYCLLLYCCHCVLLWCWHCVLLWCCHCLMLSLCGEQVWSITTPSNEFCTQCGSWKKSNWSELKVNLSSWVIEGVCTGEWHHFYYLSVWTPTNQDDTVWSFVSLSAFDHSVIGGGQTYQCSDWWTPSNPSSRRLSLYLFSIFSEGYRRYLALGLTSFVRTYVCFCFCPQKRPSL